jgi:hypothetical protein
VSTTLIALGSEEHRDLFCQQFLNSHISYDAEAFSWPELSDAERAVLANLPIWGDAVSAEYETAAIVRAMADHESDPLIAEAIAMQAREEARHARLISSLTKYYGFSADRRSLKISRDPEADFIWSGFGECVDSFVAFGLYAIAKDLKLFLDELLDLFDLVLQEEARHIVFFENWRCFTQAHRRGKARAAFSAACVRAGARVVASRVLRSRSMSKQHGTPGENFLLAGARVFDVPSPPAFLERCLLENQRRLTDFDRGLLRPRIVPCLASKALTALRLPETLRGSSRTMEAS